MGIFMSRKSRNMNVNSINAKSMRAGELFVEGEGSPFDKRQGDILEELKKDLNKLSTLENIKDAASGIEENTRRLIAVFEGLKIPQYINVVGGSGETGSAKPSKNETANVKVETTVVGEVDVSPLSTAVDAVAAQLSRFGDAISKVDGSAGSDQSTLAKKISELETAIITLANSVSVSSYISSSGGAEGGEQTTSETSTEHAPKTTAAFGRTIISGRDTIRKFFENELSDRLKIEPPTNAKGEPVEEKETDRIGREIANSVGSYFNTANAGLIERFYAKIFGGSGADFLTAIENLTRALEKYESAVQTSSMTYIDAFKEFSPGWWGRDSLLESNRIIQDVIRSGWINPAAVISSDLKEFGTTIRDTRREMTAQFTQSYSDIESSLRSEALNRIVDTTEQSEMILKLFGAERLYDPTARLDRKETKVAMVKQAELLQLISENTGRSAQYLLDMSRSTQVNLAELMSMGGLDEAQKNRILSVETTLRASGADALADMLIKAINAGSFERFAGNNKALVGEMIRTGFYDQFKQMYDTLMSSSLSPEESAARVIELYKGFTPDNIGQMMAAVSREAAPELARAFAQRYTVGTFSTERDEKTPGLMEQAMTSFNDIMTNYTMPAIGLFVDAIKAATSALYAMAAAAIVFGPGGGGWKGIIGAFKSVKYFGIALGRFVVGTGKLGARLASSLGSLAFSIDIFLTRHFNRFVSGMAGFVKNMVGPLKTSFFALADSAMSVAGKLSSSMTKAIDAIFTRLGADSGKVVTAVTEAVRSAKLGMVERITATTEKATQAVSHVATTAATRLAKLGMVERMTEAGGKVAASTIRVATDATRAVARPVAAASGAAARGMGRIASKAVPIIGTLAGGYMTYDYAKRGEYLKALLAGTSTVASLVPVGGTLVSMGIDSYLIGDDLGMFDSLKSRPMTVDDLQRNRFVSTDILPTTKPSDYSANDVRAYLERVNNQPDKADEIVGELRMLRSSVDRLANPLNSMDGVIKEGVLRPNPNTSVIYNAR